MFHDNKIGPNITTARHALAIDERRDDFKPTIILHHPHTTDNAATWRASWNALARRHPTLRAWASGVCACRADRL